MELHGSAASIRFCGDGLDPNEITRLLACEPTAGRRKGDIYHTPSGTELKARTGLWSLNADRREPANLDAQITDIFARLSDDLGVWQDLAMRFEGIVFCGLFLKTSNEGIDIKPDTLSAIGARGLTLDFDIYAHNMLAR
jgi:hypothetical protein